MTTNDLIRRIRNIPDLTPQTEVAEVREQIDRLNQYGAGTEEVLKEAVTKGLW